MYRACLKEGLLKTLAFGSILIRPANHDLWTLEKRKEAFVNIRRHILSITDKLDFEKEATSMSNFYVA